MLLPNSLSRGKIGVIRIPRALIMKGSKNSCMITVLCTVILLIISLVLKDPAPDTSRSPSESVISLFYQISAIPRCSGKEQTFSRWLMKWATAQGFSKYQDNAGNVYVIASASPGHESAPPLTLQAHQDMVCLNPGVPITLCRDGDWIRGKETNIGADNGIGLSIAMALVADPDITHGPLILLATVEEETGCIGAANIEPDRVSPLLINLDGTDEHQGIISSGGISSGKFSTPAGRSAPPPGYCWYHLAADGLTGGHSGSDIGLGRANAIVMVADLLRKIGSEIVVSGAELSGGTADNVIPKSAGAIIGVREKDRERLIQIVTDQEFLNTGKFSDIEPHLTITLTPAEIPHSIISACAWQEILLLIKKHPCGALRSRESGAVITSANIGVVRTGAEEITLITSVRSNDFGDLAHLMKKLHDITTPWMKSEVTELTPVWDASVTSPLKVMYRSAYEQVHGDQPDMAQIHAGLESGALAGRIRNPDIISVGPTILDEHMETERVLISSIDRIYRVLSRVIEAVRDRGSSGNL